MLEQAELYYKFLLVLRKENVNLNMADFDIANV